MFPKCIQSKLCILYLKFGTETAQTYRSSVALVILTLYDAYVVFVKPDNASSRKGHFYTTITQSVCFGFNLILMISRQVYSIKSTDISVISRLIVPR